MLLSLTDADQCQLIYSIAGEVVAFASDGAALQLLQGADDLRDYASIHRDGGQLWLQEAGTRTPLAYGTTIAIGGWRVAGRERWVPTQPWPNTPLWVKSDYGLVQVHRNNFSIGTVKCDYAAEAPMPWHGRYVITQCREHYWLVREEGTTRAVQRIRAGHEPQLSPLQCTLTIATDPLAGPPDELWLTCLGATMRLSNDEYILGRVPGADIILPSTTVSRRHARIFRRDGGWFFEDAGSTGGIYVDHKLLRGAMRLEPGLTVAIGDYLLRFEAERPEHKTTAPTPWMVMPWDHIRP